MKFCEIFLLVKRNYNFIKQRKQIVAGRRKKAIKRLLYVNCRIIEIANGEHMSMFELKLANMQNVCNRNSNMHVTDN